VIFVAVVCALATIAFGVYPQPLLDVAQNAGEAIKSLI
jgi:NADH-quinone oxidoreductase subunit N